MTSSSDNPDITRRTTCRVCGQADLEAILSLGPTPLANSFLKSEDEFAAEPTFPLDLFFCRVCSLFQLLDVVNPEVMFRHYLYVTGTSSTMAEHNRAYASLMTSLLRLTPNDLVIDIASNDGSLLQCFRLMGVKTLGVEPARNLAAQATASGIETINDFLTPMVAEMIRDTKQPAKVVSANNVLAHVDDPCGFLAACRRLVADDGLITIEVPYVGELVDRLEYDTVYHEHLSYFSISSLVYMCERVGLAAVQLDRIPVHGGSLRLSLSPSPSARHSISVLTQQAAEQEAGLTDGGRYRKFAYDVRNHREKLRALITKLRSSGKTLAGYGAPAKGNTLLNYCGIDATMLPYTVDKNPLKVGLMTPGTHIPVKPVEALLEGAAVPDHVLILAWNFADEIMQQQQAYRDRGGSFILPIPEPRVVA